MVIIVDSGSTKADWCIVEDGFVLSNVTTQGISPVHQSSEAIVEIVRKQLFVDTTFCQTLNQCLPEKHINAYFYGSGCIKELVRPLKAILEEAFSEYNVNFHVYNDLLGAARATCGIEPGIACILGTGANSCLFDGKEIVQNTPPLGYILGDEGSAAYIGKRFLSDCLKDIAPAQLVNDFFEYINLSPDEIMSAIYDHSLPSNTLSVYSRFLMDKLDQDYVYRLVRHAIDAFFRRNVLQYDYEGKTVCFVGSNACAYSGVLTEVADSYNIKIKKIAPSSMPGLVKYHSTDR